MSSTMTMTSLSETASVAVRPAAGHRLSRTEYGVWGITISAWLSQIDWLPGGVRELVRWSCTRMSHSYKPVLMSILAQQVPSLEPPLSLVKERFVAFYEDRANRGLPVERHPCAFFRDGRMDAIVCATTAHHVLRLVFMEQGYVRVGGGQVLLRPKALWISFQDPGILRAALDTCETAIRRFFESVELRGEALYGRPARADTGPLVYDVPSPDDPGDMPFVR